MTSPIQQADGGLIGQVLIKQGEILAELTGIRVRLEAVPDHEARIRAVEDALPSNLDTRLSNAEAALLKVKVIASTLGTIAGIVAGVVANLVHH